MNLKPEVEYIFKQNVLSYHGMKPLDLHKRVVTVMHQVKGVSQLVFYAQSTITVISGRKAEDTRKSKTYGRRR